MGRRLPHRDAAKSVKTSHEAFDNGTGAVEVSEARLETAIDDRPGPVEAGEGQLEISPEPVEGAELLRNRGG